MIYLYLIDRKAPAIYSLAEAISKKTSYFKTMIKLKAEIKKIKLQMPVESQKKIGELYIKDHGIVRFLEGRYKYWFKQLKSEIDKMGTLLIVLYPPMGNEDLFKVFFAELCRENQVPFIDAAQKLRQYQPDDVFLLPFNGHLSRFGNRLIAHILEEELEKYRGVHIKYPLSGLARQDWGNLPPNSNEIWDISPDAPYRVYTDKHGLRLKNGLYAEREGKALKILFMGDSFTFGPYLPNHDTYPEVLMQESDAYYALNAGVSGYTIRDEVFLFRNKAKYSNPDVLVLQVSDNDIYELFYYKQNQLYQDTKDTIYPEPEELSFFERIGISVPGK